MPALTFHPEFERDLTLQALARCPREYMLAREVADGVREANPAGDALLLGIGAHAILEHLWTPWLQGGDRPDTSRLLSLAQSAMHAEAPPQWFESPKGRIVQDQLALLPDQYIRAWQGITRWKTLTVNPAEAPEGPPTRLLVPLGETHCLTMPDLEVEVEGAFCIVDHKTGRYPYDPATWEWDMQLLLYCEAAQRARPDEPVLYWVDYMQKPYSGKGKGADKPQWVFPATRPFMYSAEKRVVTQQWLSEITARLPFARTQGSFAPRMPHACRRWYGWCEWRGLCFGEEGANDDA